MELLEQEISIGGKKLTLLRFVLFVASAVGLFLSLTFEIIRLSELSESTFGPKKRYLFFFFFFFFAQWLNFFFLVAVQAAVGINGAFPGWIGERWQVCIFDVTLYFVSI
jgi:hypothetical protein